MSDDEASWIVATMGGGKGEVGARREKRGAEARRRPGRVLRTKDADGVSSVQRRKTFTVATACYMKPCQPL